MVIEVWVLVLVGYAVGFLIAWVLGFRFMALDKLTGVAASDAPIEKVGAIVFAGFIGFMFGVFCPLVALILIVWKLAVAPVVKREAGR